LETRDAKHEPRSLAEQRATWMNEASAVLGGRSAVASMVTTALTPAAEPPRMADAHWVEQTADRVLAAMEQTADVPAEHANTLVDLLVNGVLKHRSVALTAPPDVTEEPGALRRIDGSSVYTVAGADLYTSQRILAAEQRLLTAAGRLDGASVEETAVDLALLEIAANGTALDVGQAALVRQMCSSGARLQLAIAPAGAGKTTAMRALTLAWTEDGGQVIGLAPSAAAAAVLAEQTGIRTMLTRGRHANHLYLQVVGDGDPHSVIRPDTISPRTPIETLQQILARDEAPFSASTSLRELNDPAARLFQAVQRYTDALHVAAEQLLGPHTIAQLDQADQYIPGLTDEPAWPTLRAHLLTLAAETGKHPLHHLLTVATGGDLGTAVDMAAVLDWRLTALAPTYPGPLPWLPGTPPTLHADRVWGPYLAKRSQLVIDLADQVQNHPSSALIGDIAVWRAAYGINPQDPRPTGGTQLELSGLWKQRLDRHIAHSTDSSDNARADELQAAHTERRRWHDHSQRPHQQPERRPSGPSARGR
jgi:hypothetical protein